MLERNSLDLALYGEAVTLWEARWTAMQQHAAERLATDRYSCRKITSAVQCRRVERFHSPLLSEMSKCSTHCVVATAEGLPRRNGSGVGRRAAQAQAKHSGRAVVA